MSSNSTEQFIHVLAGLKTGDLGLLRSHAMQGLDESVDAFDLFSGLWWPLREQKGGPPPRREVAWLIAKLYAFCPLPQSPGDTLARQLRRTQPNDGRARARFRKKFDEMLLSPLDSIEPALRWALDWVASGGRNLDWVRLTNDLSKWARETTRVLWAEQFLKTEEREESC